jgi:hypothetical protein
LESFELMSQEVMRRLQITKILFNNVTLANLESLTFEFKVGEELIYSPPVGTYDLIA